MKAFYFATVATVIARAFMSDTCEVVTIKGKGGAPVRVNKSDFDRDQASDKPTMTLHKDEPEQSLGGVQAPTGWPEGMTPTAAPAAPDYSGGQEVAPLLVDPNKEAAAPTAPAPNSRLVDKRGTGKNAKFYVVDGSGAKLEMDGVNPDGYATEAEAWNAIMALPH